MSATATSPNLTSGRLLGRNTVWNLLGQIIPMIAGLIAIPILVHGLGVDRFGLLSLAWIVIGYFSLFDLGMGRALTKLVADKLGSNDIESVPALVWTSLLLLFMLGAVGTVVAVAASPWLAHRALKVPIALQREALISFVLLSLSIPIVTVTSGLRGILEAQQRFRVANLIRIPMSIFSFVGPLLVLPFSHNLAAVVAISVLGRFIGGLLHLFACFHCVPALKHDFGIDWSVVKPLAKLGGWMTVSNIVSPVMVYMDRFVIGALLSVSAVAYYTVPFDLVSRLTVLPIAVSGVLFPAFATSLAQGTDRARLLLYRGLKSVFLLIFPAILITIVFAPEGLRLWLGADFSAHGSSVLRWLAIGVCLNSVAQVPAALVPGAGRPDLTGKLHLIELPLYLLALRWCIGAYGIEGAAIAWTARVTLDTVLLFFMTERVLPGRRVVSRGTAIGLGVLLAVLGVAAVPIGLIVKLCFVIAVLAGFVLLAWSRGFTVEERQMMLAVLPFGSNRKLAAKVAVP